MARDTLKKAGRYLNTSRFDHQTPALKAQPEEIRSLPLSEFYNPSQRLRLLGRYSSQMLTKIAQAEPGAHEPIPGTPYTWAELKQIASSEAVVHLDDLLLRRLRLGLLIPNGGEVLLERIGDTIRPELGWSDSRWEEEVSTYTQLIQTAYQPH